MRIPADTFGDHGALSVSPQHWLHLSGWRAELYAGEDEVLVKAIHLVRAGRLSQDQSGAPAGAEVVAPGMLASHYAPGKPVRLGAAGFAADEFGIGFGALAGDYDLSADGNLTEAAAHLFDALHAGAASAKPKIAVAAIPDAGLGAAINDRLARAAV